MSRDLARDSVRSALWLFGTGYAGFAVNFVVNLLVARLVFPEEFGLYAGAFAVSELIGILSALSIPLAVIHLGDDERALFDTGAWLNLAIGAASLLGAGAAAALFMKGGIASDGGKFLVILGLARIPTLMSQIGSAALEKAFRYKAVSAIGLASTLAPNVLALAMAWAGFGAWSLLSRDVAMALVLWLLTGVLTPYRFRGGYDRATARKIFAFCSRMFVSRGLQIVLERFDRLVVQLVAGNHALGIYDRSRYVSEIGVIVSKPVDNLSFNLYSRLREDLERLQKSFAVLNYFLVRLTLVLALVVLLCPREVLLLLLGPRWLEAAPTLRSMAPYAALIPIYLGLNQLLYGRGMIKESNHVRFLQVGLFVPAFVAWVATFGSTSAGLVLFVQLACGTVAMVAYQWDLLRPSLAEIFVMPLLATGVASAGFLGIVRFLPAAETSAGALFVLLVPTTLYGALLLAFEGRRLRERVSYLRR